VKIGFMTTDKDFQLPLPAWLSTGYEAGACFTSENDSVAGGFGFTSTALTPYSPDTRDDFNFHSNVQSYNHSVGIYRLTEPPFTWYAYWKLRDGWLSVPDEYALSAASIRRIVKHAEVIDRPALPPRLILHEPLLPAAEVDPTERDEVAFYPRPDAADDRVLRFRLEPAGASPREEVFTEGSISIARVATTRPFPIAVSLASAAVQQNELIDQVRSLAARLT